MKILSAKSDIYRDTQTGKFVTQDPDATNYGIDIDEINRWFNTKILKQEVRAEKKLFRRLLGEPAEERLKK